MSFYVQPIVTPLHCSCSICVTRQRQFESLSLQRRNHHNSESTPDNLTKLMIFAWLIRLQPTQPPLFVFHLNPLYILQTVKYYWLMHYSTVQLTTACEIVIQIIIAHYFQITQNKQKKIILASIEHKILYKNHNKCSCVKKIPHPFSLEASQTCWIFAAKWQENCWKNRLLGNHSSVWSHNLRLMFFPAVGASYLIVEMCTTQVSNF